MEFLEALVKLISAGGQGAITGILVVVIAAMSWDRMRLLASTKSTHKQLMGAKNSEIAAIKEIVDKYHVGNLNLVQALNEIKIVLLTIQAKISG